MVNHPRDEERQNEERRFEDSHAPPEYIRNGLDRIGSGDRVALGGKAFALGELLGLGFPVPPALVVTTDAYAARDNPRVLALFRALPMLVPWPFSAVRSSAVAEDGRERSFAGQFETLLQVPARELPRAVEQVWGSSAGGRAQAYGGARDHPMAVLVQRMVMAEISGVCFTRNPVHPVRNEAVVESVLGLGLGLVDGSITPDTYSIDRGSGRLRHSNVATQGYKVESVPDGGTRRVGIPPPQGRTRKLTAAQLRTIWWFAMRAEKYYHFPVDMEWAIGEGAVHVLQVRPVTGLPR